MSELKLSIAVWVHAHFETGKPVEADIQTFFGEFDLGLIEFMQKRDSSDLLECLEKLPTEDWLHVDIIATCEDGQWWFTTAEYKRMYDWEEIQSLIK
tara:strand:+ start:133 stop:423 length:291 start_codon:yes stop_codon:yes gene_type:complete